MKFFTKRKKNKNIKINLRYTNKITRKNKKKMVGGEDPIKNNEELFNKLFITDFTKRYNTFDTLNEVKKEDLFSIFPQIEPAFKLFAITKGGIKFRYIDYLNKTDDGIKTDLNELIENEDIYLRENGGKNCEQVSLLYHRFHGKYHNEKNRFFIVPENMYICDLTTLGFTGFISSQNYDAEYNILRTFDNLTVEQFKKICYHRGNLMRFEKLDSLSQSRIDNKNFNTLLNCFANSSWYYPGQPCYNISLSYDYGDIAPSYNKFIKSESNRKCKRFFIDENTKKFNTDYYQKYTDIYEKILDVKQRYRGYKTDLCEYVNDLILNFKNKKYTINQIKRFNMGKEFHQMK